MDDYSNHETLNLRRESFDDTMRAIESGEIAGRWEEPLILPRGDRDGQRIEHPLHGWFEWREDQKTWVRVAKTLGEG